MAVNQLLIQSLPLRVPPNDWDVVYLRDVTSKIGSGATPRGGEKVYQPQGISLIRSQNVYDHEFRKDGLVYIDDGEASKLSNVIIQPGDVLLNITGDSIARCCLVPEWVLPARVNQHVAIIRPTERLNSIYLQKYLSHPTIKAYMLGHDAGGTRKALTKGNIESFLLPLPPLPEQKAIAHILGTLDDKIELNQQMNRNLEAIAQAIFKSWFVDFDPVLSKVEGKQPAGMDASTAALFPDSFEPSALGEIPKGWQVVLLPEVAEVIDCLHSKKPSDIGQGKLLLQVWNIADAGKLDLSKKYLISEEDYKLWTSRIEVQEGDCVITNVGRVGAVAQIPQNVRAAIGRNMTAIRCKPGCLTPTYLVEYLLSPAMRAEIDLNTDSGTILDSLNVKGIEQLRLVIPPTPIMNAFEHKASTLRRHIELNIEESNSLAGIRDTLLPKLMSGEIRVKEAEQILEDVA